jgi:hypothetical protein
MLGRAIGPQACGGRRRCFMISPWESATTIRGVDLGQARSRQARFRPVAAWGRLSPLGGGRPRGWEATRTMDRAGAFSIYPVTPKYFCLKNPGGLASPGDLRLCVYSLTATLTNNRKTGEEKWKRAMLPARLACESWHRGFFSLSARRGRGSHYSETPMYRSRFGTTGSR